MSRHKPVRTRPPGALSPAQAARLAAIKAELERRIDCLAATLDQKRRDQGLVEIEEGVWVTPDQAPPPGTDRA